jgi:hypothetical protein
MPQDGLARGLADAGCAPLEALGVHDGNGKHHDRHGLVQQRQRERRLVDEGRDPERGLKDDGRRQRECRRKRGPSPQRARDVAGVQ